MGSNNTKNDIDPTDEEASQSSSGARVDDPRAAVTDLPAIHTTTGGLQYQFLWITTMMCSACKRGRVAILKDLGGGSLTGQCEVPDCSHTHHLLVSMLPPDDQAKHSRYSVRRY